MHSPVQPLTLSPTERDAYEQLARTIVNDAIAQHERFSAPPVCGIVNPLEWQHVKSKEDVSIYKTRPAARHEAPMLRTVHGGSISIASKVHVPWMLVTGTTPGTVEDLVYGAYMDSNETQRTRAFYVKDKAQNFTHLAQVTNATDSDPLRFACISWGEIKDKGIPFVRQRDLLVLSASGITASRHGERLGYYLVHSVAYPRGEQSHAASIRGQVSFCYLFRQRDASNVEIYQRGFFASMGEIPERAVVASITSNLLSPTRFIRAAYGKKLLYMLTNAPRNKTRPVHLDGCAAGCRSKLGGRWRTQGECIVCASPVCGSCKLQHKIAVGLVGLKVVDKSLAFCAVCVMRAKSLSASVFARRSLPTVERDERDWTGRFHKISLVNQDEFEYAPTEPASPPLSRTTRSQCDSHRSVEEPEHERESQPQQQLFRPHQSQTQYQQPFRPNQSVGIVLFPSAEDVVVNPRRVDSRHGERNPRGVLL